MLHSSTWLLLYLFSSIAFAQNASQGDWTAPSQPAGSVTITEGENYTIKWSDDLKNWVLDNIDGVDTSNVTLWIASQSLNYTQVIADSVDLTTTTQYTWNASLPADAYSTPMNWTFRFTPSNLTSLQKSANEQARSPVFLFAAANTSEAASTTSSGATAATSAPSTTSTTSNPSNSASAASTSSHNLSGGAIAGIVIGVLAALLLACIALFFILRRRRRAAVVTPSHHQGSKETYGDTSSSSAKSVPTTAPDTHRYSMSHYSASTRPTYHQQASIYGGPILPADRYLVDSADELFDPLR